MRISDWSSDVCSSDLFVGPVAVELGDERLDRTRIGIPLRVERNIAARSAQVREDRLGLVGLVVAEAGALIVGDVPVDLEQLVLAAGLEVTAEVLEITRIEAIDVRSDKNTSELQSQM